MRTKEEMDVLMGAVAWHNWMEEHDADWRSDEEIELDIRVAHWLNVLAGVYE